MKLYLVRHGEAVPDAVDPARPLTDAGQEQTRKLAGFLKKRSIDVPIIYHSTKLRAQQTATVLQELVLPAAALEEKSCLDPNDPIDLILKEMDYSDKPMMIVGHLPFLPRLVSRLILGKEHPLLIKLNVGSVVILEKSTTLGWVIEELISP